MAKGPELMLKCRSAGLGIEGKIFSLRFNPSHADIVTINGNYTHCGEQIPSNREIRKNKTGLGQFREPVKVVRHRRKRNGLDNMEKISTNLVGKIRWNNMWKNLQARMGC